MPWALSTSTSCISRFSRAFLSSTTGTKRSLLRPPTATDTAVFRSIIGDDDDDDDNHRGSSLVITKADEVESFNCDWTKHYHGRSSVVLKPGTVEQVSEILRYCHRERIGVVPQGGKTGLVGGSVSVNDEVLLCLSRLNRIEGFDDVAGILHCQAGCVLQNLQDHCHEKGYLVPIDLGSKGSCQIGGNLSTNAGGQYYYRYGSLAGNLIGLQAVLPDGRIVHLNYYYRDRRDGGSGGKITSNLKDNTGYKLHQLFVGAEGTLGIVTGIALWCPPYPSSRQAAILACRSYEDVLLAMKLSRAMLGEILAAFEWMDDVAVDLVGQKRTIPVTDSQGGLYPYYLLVETHGSNVDHDRDKMHAFLERVMGDDHVADGVVAQDMSQLDAFWTIRESCNPCTAATGYNYKYDLSLPVSEFADFIIETRQHLGRFHVINPNWGHILDGNLHFNVATPDRFELDHDVLRTLEPHVFHAVLRRGGSISAEHGLGQSKNQYLELVHDNDTLQTMRAVKGLLDPNSVLNPNKYLPGAT